jgi:hypothetical protein
MSEARRRRWRWTPVAGVVALVIAAGALGSTLTADGRSPGSSDAGPGRASESGSPSALPTIPAGRDEILKQPGHATQIFVIVDASETDEGIATGIRAGLADFVQQLPDYDFLTVVAAAGTARAIVNRSPLDRRGRDDAIESVLAMEFGGERNLARGISAALGVAEDAGAGVYEALLISTGVDGSTEYELRDAGRRPDAEGDSNSWFRLHSIAVGSGEHEKLMARLGDTYQWAASGSDLIRAMTAYRLVVTESTLLGFGPVANTDETLELVVGPHRFAARFSVYAPRRGLTLVAESPSGRRYDAASRGEGITVQELGERVTVVVNGAAQGTWKLHFEGSLPAGAEAWFEAEETFTLVHVLTTAFGTGDTTDELRTGLAILDQEGKAGVASATLVAPDGARRLVELEEMGSDELNIGADLTLGTIIGQPEPAGSYAVLLELDLTDPNGHARHLAWLEGAYVAPSRDSDGDGIRDALEEQNGLDPLDPSDGRADHDHDGLSTSDELVVHETSPIEWDTDSGGESDGAEVAAGRSPLDRADDHPELSCFELVPTPNPATTRSPGPSATPESVPELEAQLPDRVLGHPTQKGSMRAPGELTFVFALFDAFLACTDTQRDDLSLAFAVAADLGNWSVVAVQVDGVSGEELQDIWLYRLVAGGPTDLYEEAEVDGRRYLQTEGGWATYATPDTFFWIVNLTYGDYFGEETPAPLPDTKDIIEAFVRQLPAR